MKTPEPVATKMARKGCTLMPYGPQRATALNERYRALSAYPPQALLILTVAPAARLARIRVICRSYLEEVSTPGFSNGNSSFARHRQRVAGGSLSKAGV